MNDLKLSKSDLDWASREGLLSPDQASALWAALERRRAGTARFDLPHVAYYAGALVVISAMGWFMSEAWDSFGGGGLTAIALGYALVFSVAGRELWSRRNLRVPGGLLFVIAVCMTPLAVYGVERMTGFWPQVSSEKFQDYSTQWLLIELGTVISGVSMTLASILKDGESFSWDREVSLGFGLAMIVVTYFVDRRTREDYAFWGYLFGLLAFWTGLSFTQSESELEKFGYFLVNLVLMILSVLLQRRVFLVFGGLGVFVYLSHLVQEVFTDSLLFPLALSLIGVLIIYGGVKFQRHEERINSAIIGLVPSSVRHWLPSERGGRAPE